LSLNDLIDRFDPRVGKATISVIRDYLKDYVLFNTDSFGRYVGNPDYVIKLKFYEELSQDE